MPALSSLLLDAQTRFDEKTRRKGLAYPWWGGVTSKLLQTGIAAAAVAQRDALVAPAAVLLAVGLVALPHLLQAKLDRWVPWWFTSLSVGVGVAWIMATDYSGAVDLAPAVLAVLVAEVVATDGLRRGCVVAAAAVALTLGLDGSLDQSQAGEVVLGLFVGGMLRWQMRALLAERAARLGERERAALAERQRIAREIHDLVAHSMSITLLQVTGARRALLDADVDEASAALEDAERVGRSAMADIRRTVGLLADGESPHHPLPGATELPALFSTARDAGLHLEATVTGDLESVPSSIGLGVYRVAQEALANVTRHASAPRATVVLESKPRGILLEVANPRPVTTVDDGLGHGLTGMYERAGQLGGHLTIGPEGDAWVVRLAVPYTTDRSSWLHRALCFVHREER